MLYSTTTTVGSVGEVVTSIISNLTTGNFHRFAIQSQGQPTAVAQAQTHYSSFTPVSATFCAGRCLA